MPDITQYGPLFSKLADSLESLSLVAPPEELASWERKLVDYIRELADHLYNNNAVLAVGTVIHKVNALGTACPEDKYGNPWSITLFTFADKIFHLAHILIATHFDDEGNYGSTEACLEKIDELIADMDKVHSEFTARD